LGDARAYVFEIDDQSLGRSEAMLAVRALARWELVGKTDAPVVALCNRWSIALRSNIVTAKTSRFATRFSAF
jgi:hypothetical protein